MKRLSGLNINQLQHRPSQLTTYSESNYEMESSVGDVDSSFDFNNSNPKKKKKKMLVAKKIDVKTLKNDRLKQDHNFNIQEANEVDSECSEDDSFNKQNIKQPVLGQHQLCKSQDLSGQFTQNYYMPKQQQLSLNRYQSSKENKKLGANLGSMGLISQKEFSLTKSQNLTPLKQNINSTLNSNNSKLNQYKWQGQSSYFEGRTNNTISDLDVSPIKYSNSKNVLTENDVRDDESTTQIHQRNIFLQQKLYEGYRDVTDDHYMNNQGNIEARKIVGDVQMYKNSYNSKAGKELGLGKRKHQKKKIQQSTTMGSSSIQIMNKNEGFDEKLKNGTKGKADLQSELEVVEKRLQIVKQLEQEKIEQLPQLLKLQETKQERIFQKYEETQKVWDRLENKLKQKVKKGFQQPSVLDISEARQKQELKIEFEKEYNQRSYGQQIRSWQSNLRSIQFKEQKVQESSEASKSVIRLGKDSHVKKIIDENTVKKQIKKNEKKFQIMADFPSGFFVAPSVTINREPLVVRNTLSRLSHSRQNQSSEMSLRNKSYLQQNKTAEKFFQNTPDIDDLSVQGVSQFQKEKEMVRNSSNSYFIYRNPKITAKENMQQQVYQFEPDTKIQEEEYDCKQKGIMAQYPKLKENDNGIIVHPKLKKLKMFTNMFKGFKNNKDPEYNIHVSQESK